MSVRLRLRASPVAYGALLAALSSAAHADDLTVSSTVTAPVLTSQASNGTPGNVTLDTSGRIVVSASGAAVTVDSSNSVLNQGVIENDAQSGAVLLHLEAGNVGNITNAASAGLSLTGDGSDNLGILIDGNGTFTGNIDLESGSTFSVTGNQSVGLAVEAPLGGNVTLGTLIVTGPGATGVLTTAPIEGVLTVTGGLKAEGTATYTSTSVDPQSGSMFAIGANITGGIIIAGPTSATDLTAAATITSSGAAPTIAISPSLGGDISNIVIAPVGNLTDLINPGFSMINRGTVSAVENDPGISTLALLVGQTGNATYTASLPGGIYNRGTITASVETDNKYATQASPASADATAVEIGNGGIVASDGVHPAFLNDGTLSAQVTGNRAGTATALLIAPNGNLTSFTNPGTLSATASSSDTTISGLTAYGIEDLSGTLTTIVNPGAIVSTATLLDDNSQRGVAIDISHGVDETVSDSGKIVGDVLFGTGNSTLTIDSANASLSGTVGYAGGTLTIEVGQSGNGGTLSTADTHATTLNVGTNGTLQFVLSHTTSTSAALVDVSGDVTLGNGSHVVVLPTTFLPADVSYTLISAGGTLTVNDPNTISNQIPYLYHGNVSQQGNALTLTLQRKTASELGLSGNEAAIYTPLATAAESADSYGAALLTISNGTQLDAALTAAIPDVAGGVRALTIAMTDQATGVIGARERALVTAPPGTRDDFRFWGQEFYNSVNHNSAGQVAGYTGAGQGAALGVEWGALATVRYGLGLTFFSSQEIESHPRDTKTDGDWLVASGYGAWRRANFFVAPTFNAAYGSFRSRRTVTAGTYLASTQGHFRGFAGAGGLTTGYIINIGPVQVIPQLAFDATYLYESAYKEAGAKGLDLQLNAQSQDSVRSFAGVMAQSSFTWADGSVLPQFLAGWSHEFLSSPATINGSFEAAPGSPFRLVGPTVDTDRVIGGASVAYVFGNWSAGINYDAAASQGSMNQSATLSLSSRF
jgi:Autotransporter beta-domain